MKALLSTATGGPETLKLGELPRPTAGAGQIVIDVKACAVNFPDVLIIEDKYQFKPERPTRNFKQQFHDVLSGLCPAAIR